MNTLTETDSCILYEAIKDAMHEAKSRQYNVIINDTKVSFYYASSMHDDCEYIDITMNIDEFGEFRLLFTKHYNQKMIPTLETKNIITKNNALWYIGDIFTAPKSWQIEPIIGSYNYDYQCPCNTPKIHDIELLSLFHFVKYKKSSQYITFGTYDYKSIDIIKQKAQNTLTITVEIRNETKLNQLINIIDTFVDNTETCIQQVKKNMTWYETIKRNVLKPTSKIAYTEILVGSILMCIGFIIIRNSFIKKN